MTAIPFGSATVELERIRHNDLPAYLDAGYGARPIDEWPFVEFIRMCVDGRPDDSRDAWTRWLVGQFELFKNVPKKLGGMLGGSVDRYSREMGGDTWAGARRLAERRLALVESIAVNGYRADPRDNVHAVRAGREIVLKGGHHRAATLYVLGHTAMPGVRIHSRFVWEVYGWLKNR